MARPGLSYEDVVNAIKVIINQKKTNKRNLEMERKC